MLPPEKYSPAPIPHPDLPELRRLEEVERKLAQDYGMVHEGRCIESTAVREESRRRTNSAREKSSSPCLDFHQKDDDEADDWKLHRLYHLRRNFSRLNIKIGPIPYQASRLWAVLIGIDAYPSNPLDGCVSDALTMKEFLIDKLNVPEHRIQCLLGSNNPISGSPMTPSRANIVNVLYSLIDNVEIQRDGSDKIIIYYAGHGSSYLCSPGPAGQCAAPDSSTCRSAGVCPIQAMCPIDRDTNDADSGCWIPDISDRELNALFTQIIYAKGSRITLIAGGCYVGNASKEPCPKSQICSMSPTSRSDVNDMLHAAHTRLQHLPRYRSVLSQDWRPDMGFHCVIVMVAAIRDCQIVKDSGGGNGWRKDLTERLIGILTSGQPTNHLNHTPVYTSVVCGSPQNEPLWYPAIWCCRR